MPSITIKFPTEEMKDDFAGYMSDGGGEYGFIESRDEALRFRYRQEDSKFLEDNTIWVEEIK